MSSLNNSHRVVLKGSLGKERDLHECFFIHNTDMGVICLPWFLTVHYVSVSVRLKPNFLPGRTIKDLQFNLILNSIGSFKHSYFLLVHLFF